MQDKMEQIFTVKDNVRIAEGVYRMTLCGNTSRISAPGQFVNIKLDGHFLRRHASPEQLQTAL